MFDYLLDYKLVDLFGIPTDKPCGLLIKLRRMLRIFLSSHFQDSNSYRKFLAACAELWIFNFRTHNILLQTIWRCRRYSDV